MTRQSIWRSRRFRIAAVAAIAATIATALALPHVLPAALMTYRDDLVFRVPPDADGPTIFLTIDDGPSSATEEILRVLAKQNVPATFFITGGHVNDPARLAAIRTGGHSLGHHTQTTQACSRLSLDVFRHDFDEVDQLLTADGDSYLFRPPSDLGTREQIAHVTAHGYRSVAGTVFPLDHWFASPNTIRRLAHWLAVDGGIIILHDGAERGPRTAQVLDQLIPDLQRQGYTFGNLASALPPSPTPPGTTTP